jgi:hypothetical protein
MVPASWDVLGERRCGVRGGRCGDYSGRQPAMTFPPPKKGFFSEFRGRRLLREIAMGAMNICGSTLPPPFQGGHRNILQSTGSARRSQRERLAPPVATIRGPFGSIWRRRHSRRRVREEASTSERPHAHEGFATLQAWSEVGPRIEKYFRALSQSPSWREGSTFRPQHAFDARGVVKAQSGLGGLGFGDEFLTRQKHATRNRDGAALCSRPQHAFDARGVVKAQGGLGGLGFGAESLTRQKHATRNRDGTTLRGPGRGRIDFRVWYKNATMHELNLHPM